MKSLNFGIRGSLFSGFIILLVIACAGEPVNIDLPQNHPANSLAQEAAFIPPPNPFQPHMQMAGHETGSDSPMTQKTHPPAYQHQMNKESMTSPESSEEKPDPQHREHKQ